MVQLPPILVYGVGAMLIILGAMRFYYLGWSRRGLAPAEAEEQGRRTNYSPKRHIAWGLLWVALGLFLLVSTLLAR